MQIRLEVNRSPISNGATTACFFQRSSFVKTGTYGNCGNVYRSRFPRKTNSISYCKTIGEYRGRLLAWRYVSRFYEFVRFRLLSAFTRTIRAETLIARSKMFTLFTNFPGYNLRFNYLTVNGIRRPFAFPGNTATGLIRVFQRSSFMANFLRRKRRFVCR